MSRGEATIAVTDELSGEKNLLTPREFEILRRIPDDDWAVLEDLRIQNDSDIVLTLESLVSKGAIAAGTDDQRFARQEDLVKLGWPADALIFHFRNLRKEVQIAGQTTGLDYEKKVKSIQGDLESLVQRNGPPPEAVLTIKSRQCVELPRSELEDRFFKVLQSRRTHRLLDPDSDPLTPSDLSILLENVFGASGLFLTGSGLVLQHKTSPSGGGLHPIEAFPLLLGVEGISPGLYHYNSLDHSLGLLKAVDPTDSRKAAVSLAQKQRYVGDAQVIVFLVARWERNFWKYRARANTYNVVMMDAGHLSQTFYLTASAIGLGAFFTAALNPEEVLEFLGLEASRFGALGICGCGRVDGTKASLEIPIDRSLSRRKKD